MVPTSWSPYDPPAPWTPIVQAENVNPQAELVRPYLVHWEREQERARVDRSRLGMAVLLDIAESGR